MKRLQATDSAVHKKHDLPSNAVWWTALPAACTIMMQASAGRMSQSIWMRKCKWWEYQSRPCKHANAVHCHAPEWGSRTFCSNSFRTSWIISCFLGCSIQSYIRKPVIVCMKVQHVDMPGVHTQGTRLQAWHNAVCARVAVPHQITASVVYASPWW